MSAKLTIDNSGERFGAKTSLADIAQNSFCGVNGRFDSQIDTVQDVHAQLKEDWDFELEALETNPGKDVTATFTDGSKLTVEARGICCSGQGCTTCQTPAPKLRPRLSMDEMAE